MTLGRIIIAVVGLLITIFSSFLSWEHFSSHRSIVLGSRIEDGAFLTASEARRFLGEEEKFNLFCRRDIQEARVVSSFAILDALLADPGAIGELDTARDRAIEEWSVALECFPLHGTFWASAGMTQLRLEGPTEEALAFAEISQLVAPLEVRALQQRIFFLIAFSQTGDAEANALLREDVETLLRSGNRKLLNGIDALLGAYGRDKIKEVLLDEKFQDQMRASDPSRLQFLTKFYKVDPDIENCAPLLRRLDKCDQKTS